MSIETDEFLSKGFYLLSKEDRNKIDGALRILSKRVLKMSIQKLEELYIDECSRFKPKKKELKHPDVHKALHNLLEVKEDLMQSLEK